MVPLSGSPLLSLDTQSVNQIDTKNTVDLHALWSGTYYRRPRHGYTRLAFFSRMRIACCRLTVCVAICDSACFLVMAALLPMANLADSANSVLDLRPHSDSPKRTTTREPGLEDIQSTGSLTIATKTLQARQFLPNISTSLFQRQRSWTLHFT